LGLPVYHILENGVKEAIPPDVYGREVGPMELLLDKPGIEQALATVRGR
ncbi:MAG: glycine/sarcosine/betaine reductase complex selenoprotein A, partial [Bacillati bacterium ANGP1]